VIRRSSPRANRKNGGGVLKISMEMRNMVRRSGFGEHSDDNAKKRLSSPQPTGYGTIFGT
jgi:hypothetical protein